MKKLISILAAMLALVLCLTACGQAAATAEVPITLANGGVLCLKVNPEIAINYNTDGVVTDVTARNDDALKVLAGYSFENKQTKTVVSELVTLIGEAGYFVEEIDGQRRQITLEIEPGSFLPNDVFLEDVVAEIKAVVETHQWTTPLNVDGLTDYGPNADGVTDYIDTDYGPNADGVTDYIDTDYGPSADGVTDYIDTDYGPSADGVTDYHDSAYGKDGKTDYDDGATDYKAPTKTPSYGGDSGYSPYDGPTNYGGGKGKNNGRGSDYGGS